MNRLYRSARDKKLFGVCGGIAEATGIDATLIRIVLVLTTVFSGGAPILIYVIAAMVMPKDPTYGPSPGSGSFFNGQGQHYGGSGSHYTGGNPFATPPRPDPWNSTPPPPPPRSTHTSHGYYPPNNTSTTPNIDDLMGDIEKKAMSKEIEELKAKLAKLEKQQKGEG